MSEIYKGVVFVTLGVAEGYVFYKVGLLEPQAVIEQMKFGSFIVMKLFLSAVGTSMVAQSLMSRASRSFRKNKEIHKNFRRIYPCCIGVWSARNRHGCCRLWTYTDSWSTWGRNLFFSKCISGSADWRFDLWSN